MSLMMWTKASTRRKRIYSIIAVFIVVLAVTALGTLVPVSNEDAKQISDDLNQTVDTLNERGALTQYIFGNNFLICLLMFIPIIGPLLGLFILFNTGSVIGAISTTAGVSPILALALTLIPIGLIEFAAYSTAMAESVWLFWRLVTRRGIRELRLTSIFISICAVLLLVGAIVEVAIISIGG
jgi:uncharacterized membrane protein SpoIIM required for sporulation